MGKVRKGFTEEEMPDLDLKLCMGDRQVNKMQKGDPRRQPMQRYGNVYFGNYKYCLF